MYTNGSADGRCPSHRESGRTSPRSPADPTVSREFALARRRYAGVRVEHADERLGVRARASNPPCSQLFAVNGWDQLRISEIHSAAGGSLVAVRVDNVYVDPEAVRTALLSRRTQMWKGSSHTRNWADYFDCRTILECTPEDVPPVYELFAEVARRHFGKPAAAAEHPTKVQVNLLRFGRPRRWQADGRREQALPHVDADGDEPGAVLYLHHDAEGSGGTRFYREPPMPELDRVHPVQADEEAEGTSRPDASGLGDPTTMDENVLEADNQSDRDAEADDHLADTSGYSVLTEVPARFNSMIVHPGNITHGAWYGESADECFGREQSSQWRMTQVIFARPEYQYVS